MKSVNQPPRLALQLLELSLYENNKDDIIGDLREEFLHNNRSPFSNVIWFWKQAISTAFSYGKLKPAAWSLLIGATSLSFFVLMMFGIMYLSHGNSASVYNHNYWTDGNAHRLFWEPHFWEFVSLSNLLNFEFSLFINIPALLWSAIGILVIRWLAKSKFVTDWQLSIIALLILIAPYAIGYWLLANGSYTLREVGPILAPMWLSFLYLVIPVSYTIFRSITRVKARY